jgi:tetratricopeptide (TPR) repeat protein
MDIKKEIEKLIKSAELYCNQGLYQDAKTAYQKASSLIQSAPNLKNKDSLLAAMDKKVKELGFTAEQVESAPSSHELPTSVQNLIKNLFSLPEQKDPHAEALAGAITLAKFGQTERAIQDLTLLLEKDSVQLAAAKNIIRCHMFTSNHEKAIEAFQTWATGGLFSDQRIQNIKIFLESQLEKKGITLPPLDPTNNEAIIKVASNVNTNPADAVLDIGSVLINFDQGPLKDKPVELDVNFQTGNTVSLLIESKDKNILENLNIGFHLKDVQYRSSVAIFRGDGVVKAKLKIHEGPKKGDYHMDITVQDTTQHRE